MKRADHPKRQDKDSKKPRVDESKKASKKDDDDKKM